MQVFHSKLEEFASKYKKEIQSDPIFRAQFQTMCSQIGVDPLASSKGFWAELLGVGDFYYELAVQIITLCIQARDKFGNGGLLDFDTLKARLGAIRKVSIGDDDIVRAVKSIQVLGSGFSIVQIKDKRLVQSVPMDLSTDHTLVISLAQQQGGKVTASDLSSQLKWTADHAEAAIVIGSMRPAVLFHLSCSF